MITACRLQTPNDIDCLRKEVALIRVTLCLPPMEKGCRNTAASNSSFGQRSEIELAHVTVEKRPAMNFSTLRLFVFLNREA